MNDTENAAPVEYYSREVHHEEIVIRPATTTRQAIKITLTQRATKENEFAMSTAVLSGHLDIYYEKPDILLDIANNLIYAALVMRRLNKKVRNGK